MELLESGERGGKGAFVVVVATDPPCVVIVAIWYCGDRSCYNRVIHGRWLRFFMYTSHDRLVPW